MRKETDAEQEKKAQRKARRWVIGGALGLALIVWLGQTSFWYVGYPAFWLQLTGYLILAGLLIAFGIGLVRSGRLIGRKIAGAAVLALAGCLVWVIGRDHLRDIPHLSRPETVTLQRAYVESSRKGHETASDAGLEILVYYYVKGFDAKDQFYTFPISSGMYAQYEREGRRSFTIVYLPYSHLILRIE